MTNIVEASSLSSALNNDRPSVKGRIPGASSMWFFIIGDLLIFGVYFVAYMVYRGHNHELFLHSQQELNQRIGVINTLVLITSSFLVALGTEAARDGKSVDAARLFGFAFAVGCLFPVLKTVEWIPKISSGMTPGEDLFFMFYYIMAGLHLCHVIVGLIIMTFVMSELRTSKQPNLEFVETGAMYWHMVDVLWLILFALLYLMR